MAPFRGKPVRARVLRNDTDEALSMIAQTIQLALAPVFVLVAIGNIMNLLSTRLGRVVDRARTMQERHSATSGVEHDLVVREIRLLDRRILLIGRAILLLVLSGLTIGLTVVILFLGDFLQWDLPQLTAASFILRSACSWERCCCSCWKRGRHPQRCEFPGITWNSNARSSPVRGDPVR